MAKVLQTGVFCRGSDLSGGTGATDGATQGESYFCLTEFFHIRGAQRAKLPFRTLGAEEDDFRRTEVEPAERRPNAIGRFS
jgi:hypothetical protein